jgi:hypothetical protein
MDAKASLAKEMKGKDYDQEGVNSCSSKRTHRTNMTGKMGVKSTWSVTTKKFVMNFSQNKKNLNAERKKTALLDQRIKEMESALAARIIRVGSKKNRVTSNDNIMVLNDVPHKTFDCLLPPNAKQKSVNISTPWRIAILRKKMLHSWTYPPPPVTNLPRRAALLRMRWVGGITCLPESPLLQVEIEGVGRTPLWRIIHPTNLTLAIHVQKATPTLAGPLVWLPI